MGNLSTVMVIAVAVRDDFLLNYLIAPLDAIFVHFARIERVQIIRVTLVTIFFCPLSTWKRLTGGDDDPAWNILVLEAKDERFFISTRNCPQLNFTSDVPD